MTARVYNPPLHRPPYIGACWSPCIPQITCQAHTDRSDHLPLLEAVAARAKRTKEVAFHVPGHKRGAGVHHDLTQVIGPQTLVHDTTELDGLDYLAYPTGVIQEAQRLAAEAFGAESTWFLVNGTTCGILAAVLATCGTNNTLVLARNCHLSAISAMVLAGCTPCYMPPCLDEQFGLAHGVSAHTLRQALQEAAQRNKQCGAALVVSPTYYGACSNVRELAEVCHNHGVPLVVDEAHGSHFEFHESFPQTALAAGADIVIQSTHKTLSALTQASMLHVQGSLVNHARVSRALHTVQSSSPSYILMASLDAARAHAAAPGVFEEPVRAAQLARHALKQLAGIALLDVSSIGAHLHGLDPLRLTVNVKGLGMSGFEVIQVLERDWGVVAELATPQVVVFAMGIGTSLADAHALISAFQSLAETALQQQVISAKSCEPGRSSAQHQNSMATSPSVLPEIVLRPKEAFESDTERLPLHQAAGRVSAELLCPYPPGVPLLVPGERLSTEAIHALQAVLASGGIVLGTADASCTTLEVVVGV